MRVVLIISFLLTFVLGWSQKIVVKTDLTTTNPYINEEFQVTYKLVMEGSGSISHNGLRIKLDDPPVGLTLVNKGQPRSNMFSFGQGMTIGQYAVIYKSNKTGTYKLPAFSFYLSGKEYQAEEKVVKVTKGMDYSNRNETRDFFVDLKFSKTSTYKGAPIVCKVLLFSKVQLKDYGVGKPDFQGFKVTELKTEESARKINVGNQTYLMYQVGTYQLLPLKVGKQKLNPIDVELIYAVSRGFFAQHQRKKIQSLSYTVEVNPFPKPIPSNFQNAVGDFKVTSSLDKTSLDVNDAATWKITISGTGNLEMIDGPNFEFTNDLEVFDPKVKANIQDHEGGSTGSKTFEYVIVPRVPGEFKLPTYELTYFDLSQEAFVTKETTQSVLNVEGEVQSSSSPQGVQQKHVEVLSEDIRYIQEETDLVSIEQVNRKSWIHVLFWMVFGLTILLVIFGDRLKRSSKSSDVNPVRLRKTITNLSIDDSQFLSKLQQNWIQYLCLSFNLSVSEFNKQQVKERLGDSDLSQEIIRTLEELEMASYASGMLDKEGLKERILKCINGLES